MKTPRVDFAAVVTTLRPVLGWVRLHRFWAECATLTLLGLLAAFSLGYAALSRTSILSRRIAELQRVEAGFDRWATQLQPPSPAESLAWRESQRAVLSLGADSTDPLALAQLIARRAEEVGISEVSIRLVEADSVAAMPAVDLGAWRVESSSEGLLVEFDGTMGDVVGFLGALPAQAAVSSLQIEPTRSALHAKLVLVARKVVPRGS